MAKVSYTAEQEDAIKYDGGNLRIIACAGSGKTEVISSKIVKLIKDGTKPKSIVAFTFTNKASEEMRMRIRSKLDHELPERSDIGEMYMGTIDRYCFRTLQDLEPKYKTFSMLDENQRFSVVFRSKNYYNELKLMKLEDKGKTGNIKKGTVIKRFLDTVDLIRNENIDIEKSAMSDFKDCFKAFQEFMEKNRLLDFTSVIYELNKLLQENKEVVKELSENLKYLVVDEYQDVNNSQERLIENIVSGGKTTLIVVGDDDQNIFNWRGSNIKNILNFKNKYPDAETKYLSVNFRSTDGIVSFAKTFIENNKKRLNKPLIHNKKRKEKFNTGDIVFKRFSNNSEEADNIVSNIKEIYQRKITSKNDESSFISLGDIAILVRRNEDAKIIISKLEKAGINVVTSIGESVFNSEEVVFVKDILRYIFQLLFKEGEEKSIAELKKDYERIFPSTVYSNVDTTRFEKIILLLKKEIEQINEKDKPYINGGLQNIFHNILDAIGLSKFELVNESKYYNLAVMSRVIADYEDAYIRVMVKEIKEFFFYYWTYASGNYDTIKNEELEYIKDAVKVLSIHKAKGLEFPVVFIPRFIQPKRKKKPEFLIETTNTLKAPKLFEYENYVGDIEDDRRTTYVAITRSEKYLFISSCDTISEATTKTIYEPSIFIKEFDAKLIANKPSLNTDKVDKVKNLSDLGILFPTSFSELSSYHKCPYEYKIRRIYGFKAGIPVAFGYGERVHNIINIIYKKFKETPPSEKQIDTLFDNYFHLRYALKFLEDKLKEKGKSVVKNYVKAYGKEFDLVLETEKNFELVVDNALVNGQIDLIKKLDQAGNIKDIQIIDFKTDNDKSAYKNDKENNLQLRIYAQACLDTLGYHPEKASVLNLNTLKTEDVDIKKDKLNDAKEEIRTRVKKITKERTFEAKPSHRCADCDFSKFCSKKHTSTNIKDKVIRTMDKFRNGEDPIFTEKK